MEAVTKKVCPATVLQLHTTLRNADTLGYTYNIA